MLGTVARVSSTHWSKSGCLVRVNSFSVSTNSLLSSIFRPADCLSPPAEMKELFFGESPAESGFSRIFFAIAIRFSSSGRDTEELHKDVVIKGERTVLAVGTCGLGFRIEGDFSVGHEGPCEVKYPVVLRKQVLRIAPREIYQQRGLAGQQAGALEDLQDVEGRG